MKFTFFAGSIIGYIGHPEALFTRSLADALVARGNDVRLAEARQNEHYVRTLEIDRAPAARAMFESFPTVQYHSFDMRRGPRLFEWLAREIALIDVAVAVDGVDDELVRWLANLNQPRLTRIFQTYRPAKLDTDRADSLELGLFNAVAATDAPPDGRPWSLVRPSVARADIDAGRLRHIGDGFVNELVDPAIAAEDLMSAVERARTAPAATPLPPREAPS